MHHKKMKIVFSPDMVKEAPNVGGTKGEVCNNCGGYGFTLGLKGVKLTCHDCGQTGVKELTMAELSALVQSLKQDLTLLKLAIVETLQSKGVELKTDIGKTKAIK